MKSDIGVVAVSSAVVLSNAGIQYAIVGAPFEAAKEPFGVKNVASFGAQAALSVVGSIITDNPIPIVAGGIEAAAFLALGILSKPETAPESTPAPAPAPAPATAPAPAPKPTSSQAASYASKLTSYASQYLPQAGQILNQLFSKVLGDTLADPIEVS